MALTVNCPSCHKTLRLGEDSQGKKLRCPACQQVFLAPTLPKPPAPEPDPDPEPPPRESYREVPVRRDPDEDDREDDRRPRRRDPDADDRPSRRQRDDDDDRPSRRRREYDDEDDYRRPRRRWREDDDFRDEGQSGNTVKVLGILSCVFCLPICAFGGLVGFVLGLIAVIMASSELGGLRDRRYDSPRVKNLKLGRTLGIVGMCLSVGFFLLLCVVNVAMEGAQF